MVSALQKSSRGRHDVSRNKLGTQLIEETKLDRPPLYQQHHI